MKSVTNFINSLGDNYYSFFIIQSDAEVVDFTRYDLKVFYNNNYYYELNLDEIHLKRREILNNVRDKYQKALSEIYINISTREFEYLDSFLHFNLEAVKLKIKTLKNDFYIDNNLSRYYTEIDTNNKILKILSLYIYRYSKDLTIEINDEILNTIKDINLDKNEIPYLLDYFYKRFSAISFLPLALYTIGNQFYYELQKIQSKIELIKDNKFKESKIKWIGTKTHIGFLISTLEQNGYLDAPKNKNGEVNYTAFAKLIKQNFEINISDDTLRKYLNPSDDKFNEAKKVFDKEGLFIPHSKSIN
ncbi:hypothetical protein KJK34_04890 [Flavobacterium sp. D11R37]|uniref:hypothetical protein n=1 Tax=Flavobacterium coralii TaxID=2838017 RepID=UPI001CA74B32|nr:hypothetical protein [Flavobacterium coralii]MBY8962084.1 hypothetical protein [Flavobacterium coralii]